MGAKLSKHFRNQHGTRAVLCSSNDGKPSLMIMEIFKPECLRTKKMRTKKKKRIQMDPDEKKITKVRKLTLEEWLLASPASPASLKSADQRFGSSGGELHVFKHFSNKVHPSSASTITTTVVDEQEDVVATTSSTTQPRDASGFSTDHDVSASFSMDVSSSIMSCRSQRSGKSKKRVSFKLPEEADIILFHSPEEEKI